MVKSRPAVIAHRGAPGYLPEHTLPAKALAYAMGADFLEQDVVATRDDELVVLHDIYLDRVSDVAERFPQRARPDGRYYVRDFDLAELRSLKVSERRQADGSAVYARRFPPNTGNFRIHTFAEELEFLEALNNSTSGTVGCYPEIKRPAWHREQGVDIAPLFLQTLQDFAYNDKEHAVFVQCFDADELVRIRNELGCRLPLVQLIGENDWGEGPTDFDRLRTRAGLQQLAETVNAIGPSLTHLYFLTDAAPKANSLCSDAHDVGLLVHPYTFRKDELPPGFDSFTALIDFALDSVQVDGLFTDFADVVRSAVDDRA
jgi:glycerophosphoryl diester phosphodiesterase